MDYPKLERRRERLAELRGQVPAEAWESFDRGFDVEYAHNSTAIEGNTLTLIQTKAVLEDGISVGGKSLREIYEVVNHAAAFDYVKKCVADSLPLDEKIVKDIHALLMERPYGYPLSAGRDVMSDLTKSNSRSENEKGQNSQIERFIFQSYPGGIYRNVEVRISGAGHKPPPPSEMYWQVKEFFAALPNKAELNAIELASWTHAEFVRIHPFQDGNGRASRMMMNYQLMSKGFLPVSIAKEDRLQYFEALEAYAVQGNLEPFADIIADLEEKRLTEYLGIRETLEQPQPGI